MNPIISVCVPTYNGAKYFRECLDSILVQTLTDFELLIVDDHSSDDTLKIAQEYVSRDARVRVTKNDRNLGLVGNWNRCVELAQGEWIKFVFQDDLIAPTCLEKMLAACDADSAIAFCRRDFIFEEGTPERTKRIYAKFALPERDMPFKRQLSAKEYSKVALDRLGFNFVGEPTVLMIRKSTFEQFGNFNPHLIQICDLEMWTRIASNVGIVYVPESLATFRVHAGATTSSNHSQREYRMRLDGIVLKHDFLFHPAYENLRAFQSRQWFSTNLLRTMKKDAYFAWIIATRAKNEQTSQSLRIVQDWEDLLISYPSIKAVMQLSTLEKAYFMFLRKIIHWQWQLTTFFETQFQT